jgi:hypothetical protein
MAGSSAKEDLIAFLDKKAFNPVLRARSDEYPENERAKLAHVQDATRAERDRFHRYGSAQEVVRMPTLPDIREEFDHLARDLGIEG